TTTFFIKKLIHHCNTLLHRFKQPLPVLTNHCALFQLKNKKLIKRCAINLMNQSINEHTRYYIIMLKCLYKQLTTNQSTTRIISMNKIVKLTHILYKDNYINEVLNETAEENPQNKLTEVTVVGANDDWDDGLTFTAKSSPDSDRANNNSLIAHIQNLPGFDASKARIVQHYAAPSSQHSASESPERLISPDDPPIGPTAAELILPWRRDRSYQSIGNAAASQK
ncbi:hypothetical protein DOY81_001725, partial [Sarcophaga bullata]